MATLGYSTLHITRNVFLIALPLFQIAFVRVRRNHVGRGIVNADHGILCAGEKLCIFDCIIDCVRLAVRPSRTLGVRAHR